MAEIIVDTLTEDCWKYCDNFEINKTLEMFDKHRHIYNRFFGCKHVAFCRSIRRMAEGDYER